MRYQTIMLIPLLLTISSFSAPEALAQDDYSVFRSARRGESPDQMLYKYLTEIVYEYLEARKEAFSRLQTTEDVRKRGHWVREIMTAALGPWPPERTPLNAQVTGQFSRERYRVEKLVFQSRPGFYVTANLYLPPLSMGEGPFPAVLGPCGHTMLGKAYEPYQKVYSTLASLGFVVLTYDPPGQGERLMYYDVSLGESLLGSSTVEHSMAGLQCLLSGSNAASYFIWDGIRGIDYLTSRPEVDASRIAVTGNSGGGTLTAYIAALDDRVKAAAPTCYITSWKAMWDTYGMADAEQNLIPIVAQGFDYSDYIMPFAPKPYLVNAGIQDFFSIRGARETAKEMGRIYSLWGNQDRFMLFESDEGHGYTKPRREATYAWLGKHLAGIREAPLEPEMQPERVRDLWASPTGQVSTSFDDAETIASLNVKFTEGNLYQTDLPSSLDAFRTFSENILQTVMAHIRYGGSTIPLDTQSRGFAEPISGAASVQRLTFECEPGITIPGLLIRARIAVKDYPLVLYLPDQNKTWELAGDVSTLATAGYNIFCLDLRGKGETQRMDVRLGSFYDWFSRDWDIAMVSLQLEKPLVAGRTLDIVRSVDMLNTLDSGKLTDHGIVAIGKQSAAIPLLHAALIDKSISGIILEGGLLSWQHMISAKLHRGQFDNIVPGALQNYDLPVIAAALAPRPLTLANLSDSMGHMLDPGVVRDEYAIAVACYELLGKPGRLRILERPQAMPITKAYENLLSRSE